MSLKKTTKIFKLKKLFAVFLVLIGMVAGVMSPVLTNDSVYAEPTNETIVDEERITTNDEPADTSQRTDSKAVQTDTCKKSLGALGWIVCPLMNKVTEAVDWLYEKIEDILIINPISAEDGSPIYEIWKYCLSVTNIVFIIFFLVVIYSQITGWGITNYGLKKTLPKLIVMVIMVNLSFLICSLLIDVSNIIGNSLRGVFESVESTVLSNAGVATEASQSAVSMADMYTSMAGGTALAVGAGMIAFEFGTIWMLIPTALGAIVSVVIGLVTIALRQAVVMLLVMISPLAFVAGILPNTEDLYKKWKKLLTRMLVFYPAFSLLFGASSLAGFAIIMSAKSGFGLLLGIAVQIFPLFFSWKLMQMSGTFLGDINSRLHALTAKPLAANRAWADSHRQLARQKRLATGRTPSARLMQFLSNRKIAREEELSELAETAKLRGQAYAARRNYRKNGLPSREGEEAYERQALNMGYSHEVDRHKNNMNMGLGQLDVVKNNASSAQKARLDKLDLANVKAADILKIEKARGEKIEYENAKSFHKRMDDAINAHFDDKNRGKDGYKMHNIENRTFARTNYETMNRLMEGDIHGIHYAAASAAQGYDTQKKIMETKMQKYFELTPPTKDVEYRLGELTMQKNAQANIDAILPGLRVLNQRGDTDIVRRQMENILNSEKGIDLGSHASQALASFLMFEVKDNDPFLRRFGKYINLETAQVYNNANKRQNKHLTLNEYITGEYDDWEPNSEPDAPKVMRKGKSKRPMSVLMEGTSLDGVERTAFLNLDEMLVNAYKKDGKLDVDKYLAKRNEIETAFGPAFISASLKYLSGSEQLKNAVSFLTGYDGDTARWEDKKNDLYESKEAKAYFRKKTIEYLKNQTPTQILGLRSDYYSALKNHLSDEYENTNMKGWSEEAIAEHEEIMKERAEIQTRYGDLPVEEAQKRRANDLKALRDKMAGAQFRQILDSKGKLNQIYRTRRSGAANNAKDWVRSWLDLDNEVIITQKLENDREKMKKEIKEAQKKDGDSRSEEMVNRIYTLEKRAEFVGRIENIWNDMKEESDEAFFEESLKYIEKEIGKGSYIAIMYKKFHEDDGAADSHTMKEYLCELLRDAENY